MSDSKIVARCAEISDLKSRLPNPEKDHAAFEALSTLFRLIGGVRSCFGCMVAPLSPAPRRLACRLATLSTTTGIDAIALRRVSRGKGTYLNFNFRHRGRN